MIKWLKTFRPKIPIGVCPHKLYGSKPISYFPSMI